jgi:hypothetical protein
LVFVHRVCVRHCFIARPFPAALVDNFPSR